MFNFTKEQLDNNTIKLQWHNYKIELYKGVLCNKYNYVFYTDFGISRNVFNSIKELNEYLNLDIDFKDCKIIVN